MRYIFKRNENGQTILWIDNKILLKSYTNRLRIYMKKLFFMCLFTVNCSDSKWCRYNNDIIVVNIRYPYRFDDNSIYCNIKSFIKLLFLFVLKLLTTYKIQKYCASTSQTSDMRWAKTEKKSVFLWCSDDFFFMFNKFDTYVHIWQYLFWYHKL